MGWLPHKVQISDIPSGMSRRLAQISVFNAEYEPYLRRIFLPLIKKDFLEIVCGGPKEGGELINNPLVTMWFMTGQ